MNTNHALAVSELNNMKYFISSTIISVAFIQIVTSSEKRKRKTLLQMVVEGDYKLATKCEIDELIVPSFRAKVQCPRRCREQLRGYINDKDELVCYTPEAVSTVPVSRGLEPCTCGYPKPNTHHIDDRKECIPKLSIENIPDMRSCSNECGKHIALRLRKLRGPLLLIWCGEKLIEERKRHLDYSLEVNSGMGTPDIDFKCLCGLKNEYKSSYKLHKFLMNTGNESKRLATKCAEGPFRIFGKIQNCGSFCDTAKGYFLPNSDELICYHIVKKASVMPPLSTNKDEIPSDAGEITCECGGFFENRKEPFSPCIPKRKHSKPKDTPFTLFKRQCEFYCAKFAAYVVDSQPTPKVVRCYLHDESPHTTLSNLNSKSIWNSVNNPPASDSILCECGIEKFSIVKSSTPKANSSRLLDFTDDKFFENILNDPHFEHSLASSALPIYRKHSLNNYGFHTNHIPGKKCSKNKDTTVTKPVRETTFPFNVSLPSIDLRSQMCEHEKSLARQVSFDLNADAMNALDAFNELITTVSSPQKTSSPYQNNPGFDEIMPVSPGDHFLPSTIPSPEVGMRFDDYFKLEELIPQYIDD